VDDYFNDPNYPACTLKHFILAKRLLAGAKLANIDFLNTILLLDNKAGIRYFDLSRFMIRKMDNE